jgi:DNA-binding NarL/FixJ family response regulator
MTGPVRVLIADDQALFREALSALLEVQRPLQRQKQASIAEGRQPGPRSPPRPR